MNCPALVLVGSDLAPDHGVFCFARAQQDCVFFSRTSVLGQVDQPCLGPQYLLRPWTFFQEKYRIVPSWGIRIDTDDIDIFCFFQAKAVQRAGTKKSPPYLF